VGTVEVKKVVIDTSVLVSALLFGGVPAQLISLWKSRTIRPLCSGKIMDELLRVLAYPKFSLSKTEIEYLITQEIVPWFEVVDVSSGRTSVKQDPSDDKFIWCAEAGRADFIISGDEHLLSCADSPIPVVTVAQFLAQTGCP
jgi:putative PIN family toxin of toxin-antitoxin system